MPQWLSQIIRHGHSYPWSGLLTAGLIAAALSGCARNGPEAAFTQYQTRLARTLAVEAGPSRPTHIPARPARRDLIIPISAGRLDALDFLDLSGCAVQVTIGKRNSSLGRMARASQRLLLELEYLQLAPACITHLREQGETALATTLEQARELKYQQLPALIFNATLGSAEYREFWKIPAEPGNYPTDTGSALLSSLEAINELARRWLAGDFRGDNPHFEVLLGEVARGDGGSLQRALAEQAGALAMANRILDERMQRGPLCSPGVRPATVDILGNVVRKYFIGGIQPRAAALNRRYHALLPPVEALEATLESALPQAYREWRQRRDKNLAELALSPRQHVEKLQIIQAPCTARALAGR